MLPGSVTYTRELADEICERIAAGQSLKEICRSPGMPSDTAVRKWAIEDHDGFSSRYARARDLQLEALSDDLLEISDDGRNDWMVRNKGDSEEVAFNSEHVQRSKLRSDNRKWLLSKLKPEKYGDRTTLTGANGRDLIPDTRDTDARIIVLLMKAGLSETQARQALLEHEPDAG